jgi:hypothetical protein
LPALDGHIFISPSVMPWIHPPQRENPSLINQLGYPVGHLYAPAPAHGEIHLQSGDLLGFMARNTRKAFP